MITQAQQDDKVRNVIAHNPWVRADEIAAHLGWAVSAVSASLRRLKSAKAVRSRGRTRATAYRLAA